MPRRGPGGGPGGSRGRWRGRRRSRSTPRRRGRARARLDGCPGGGGGGAREEAGDDGAVVVAQGRLLDVGVGRGPAVTRRLDPHAEIGGHAVEVLLVPRALGDEDGEAAGLERGGV